MSEFEKPEQNEEPAPDPEPMPPLKEFSDCAFFCFYIDQDIYDKEGFKISSSFISNLSVNEFKFDNIVVFCVHCQGLLNYALKLFKSSYYFKISYRFKNIPIFTSNFDFIVEKNKIKFIFDAGNKGSIANPLFINPSCLEQYNAFCKVTKKYDILLEETINFLSNNLDIELYLYLLENIKEERDKLMDILSKFPNYIVKYEKNKQLKDFDFTPFTNYKYYNKLILIYSIIQDSTNLITDFTEKEISDFILYNETQKDQPLLIKKNIFNFFMSKTTNEKDIKRICQSVYSIPLLFECLIGLKEEELQKIKNLTYNDLPIGYSFEDNLIELIEKYEKIKVCFAQDEIKKVWKAYLNLWYSKKNIKELEEIIDKLNSIDEKYYSSITKEIKEEVVNKGKRMIEKKNLKSLEMYKFINKYNSIGDFFSDENLLNYIGGNIILEELNSDSNTLDEFNQCKFFIKIKSKLITYFIIGTLSQVNTFENFYFYFKYIYPLKEKEEENIEKNVLSVNLILSHFNDLLTKIPNIKINDDFQDIVRKIILLSLMYIPEDKNNNYIQIINNLGNCRSFTENDLFTLFIETIINTNTEAYISNELKDKACEYIIKKFYFKLNIEQKIEFLLKIKSVDIKEKLILVKFPNFEFSDFLTIEESISINYLKNFIEKGLMNKEEFTKSSYFKNLISKCNLIKDKLEKKDINFSVINQLKELIFKEKLSNRILYICLGNSKCSSELEDKIKIYTEKYIIYYSQLDILITYYNKYYPNSKKEEINKYTEQQSNFKEAKKNMSEIELKEEIDDEIKIFEKYDKSKFFYIFYSTIELKNGNQDEVSNFTQAIEIFNKCEKLFTDENFELALLDVPLKKLEDNDNGDNLKKEINYLKENFGIQKTDEKKICENLLLYKNRITISKALRSVENLCERLNVNNLNNANIEKLANDIEEIKVYSEISNCARELKKIDEKFLEKNFLEILLNFNQNDKLISFLETQKESETRDLIDGLFDDENEENFTIELKDIEILINVVCFFQDIKSKTNNLSAFLNNFHSILDKKRNLYKEIVSNIVHINAKMDLLQDYIKIQLGKKFKFSTNIEKFINSGIIKFKKMKKQSVESMLMNIILGKEIQIEAKEVLFFNAIVITEGKEENFEKFLEIIRRIRAKNIYKYGKNKENILKAKKIAQLIQAILKELNLDINQEFDEVYEVAKFEFVNKGILKLPQLENVLDELRKKNFRLRSRRFQELENNPALQFLLGIDLIDFDEIENKRKIESYFPNIKEIEDNYKDKIVHKNVICDGCGMKPLVGIRYKCKTCDNFDYCEECLEKYGQEHGHEFNKIEVPEEKDGIPGIIMLLLLCSQIRYELNYLKGIFFYKSTKEDYEIDILKFFNKLVGDSASASNSKNKPKETDKGDDDDDNILPKNLPYFFNLLLCYDDITENEIYAFCTRAINCITHNLFFIVRPEEFKINQERFLFKTLNKLLEKNENKINSCIIVLYINQNSHIIKQLKNLKEKCEFPEEPPIFKTIEDAPLPDLKNLPVEIVTSDSPRVGKSHYIRTNLNEEFAYSILYPLGDVDQFYLTRRTDSINRYMGEKFLLIFELYENPDEKTYNLIKNFLFQFLILKMYRSFTYIARSNIKIFIEVSSDYTNFYEDFKFLKPFRRHHIEFKNHLDFYEKNKIVPMKGGNISDVLNCLKLLKSGQINKSNLSSETVLNFIFNPREIVTGYDSLIKEYFINKFPAKNILPNFGQIEIFSDILGDLIYSLEENNEINPKTIMEKSNSFPILKEIRGKIISSYIDFVIKFTAFSYESILENQEIASKHQKQLGYKLTDDTKKKLIEEINKKRVVTYNDIRPGIILFNNIPKEQGYLEINKCTILTTYKEGDRQYKELNDFYHNYLGYTELLSLNEFGGSEFRVELKNICLTPDDMQKNIIMELEKSGYEFTIDNFVKMVLIYLRIRARVPLILLGETGCGKTSLIEALYLFLQDRYELIKFNIHSGLSYHDISSFFDKNQLFKENSELKEIKEKLNLIVPKKEKDTILFLDEINTTSSLNLLCDIFVRHSFLGHPLKPNLFVIAACNPYRLMLADTEEIGYINKKMHRVRNLVYTVNPLPLCLINYVFDFGNVKDEDEQKYIRKFVNTFLNKKFSVSNSGNFTKILEIIILAVFEAQKFIRKNSEISAVSLREIKRFRIFFEFFFKITKERKEFQNPDFSCIKDISIFDLAKNEDEKIEDFVALKAANLSLFMCFYIRIINPQKRKDLAEMLENIIKFDFLEYPLKMENELADSLNLDKGIAKNKALLDNIFTLFVCLNNKIPVFICGKAGCSKSLSFSLLFQAMKGEYSKNELFKKYPSLYVTSYQGSLTSSSYEIKTIFNRAKKIIEKQKDKSKNLSVILFDEMGLAEISPNNPLKVIHSELDGKQEVGFVGISNWTLDASKMNRAIHLSVQEPDLPDLILTATTIANDIYEEIGKIAPYKNLIENLTKSYFDYKNHLKKNYVLNYDFHGARDFYYLIKIAARTLKNNVEKKSLEKIGMESIERNFGGLELDKEGTELCPSTQKVKALFSKHQNNFVENIYKYDIFSCVKNNLENENNRYLLLITNKTKNETLIELILKKLNKKYRFIQGSKLKEDQNEDYVLEKTWSIIKYMENGEIIILKDLEIIYPKFYDLFNQNFQKFGNSQYARIVLDSTTNERHIVNKNFRCIVLLEQNDVNEQDPPFLNRFEKHLMSFRYLLTENQNRIAKEIYNEIKELTTIPENKKMLPLLVNINREEIRSLLLNLATKYEDKNDNYENHIEEIYKLLIPTFTQENILNAIFSPEKKYIKKADLIKIYEENSHTNIFKFLEEVKSNKLMIYTFSPYYKDIFTELTQNKINNEKYGLICKDNTVEITFNQKLSENMLKYFFQLYYEKENNNLFIIHFRLRDSKYLKYIKYQLDEFHKTNQESEKKIYMFIIHIEKNYDIENNRNEEDPNNKSVENLEKYHSYFFSYLSEYKQITIDNLLELRDISVTDIYNKTNEELMVIKELFDTNLIIKKEFSRQITQMPVFQNKNEIMEKLDNLSVNGTLDCIIKKIQSSIKNSDNILRRILVNYSSLIEKDFDFISYFLERIILIISENVEKLIKELGQNGYLVSYLFEEEIPPKLKKTIFYFINNINITKVSSSENLDEYLLDMKIPGSKLLFKKLSNLVKNCKTDYLNIDDEYRRPSKKKTDKKEKKKTLEEVHYKKKQYLKSRLWNEELLNDDIFSEYFQDILKDYFVYTFYNINTKTSLNKKQEEFLLFLYSKRNINDNVLDRFLYFNLWIDSYFEAISKFLEIFNKLDKYIKQEKNPEENENMNLLPDSQSLLDSLKENYDLFNLSGEKDKEKEAEKEKVNGIFYRVSEAICHVMTNINNIDFDSLDLKQFCADLNEVAQTFTQFNSTLSLGLKGQFSLLSISKIIEFAIKNKKDEKEFKNLLSIFIKNIYNERCDLFKNDIRNVKKSFNEQINIAINLSEELASKIFVNKLLQYTKYEDYKLELVKTLFEYPKLIKFSSLFFNYIFLTQPIKPKRQLKKNISEDDKHDLLEKFGEIKNLEKNKILKEINTQAENNEILKEILIYIFELRLLSYFKDCQNAKLMKDKDKILILTGLNLDYFLLSCNSINNNNFGKLNNLGEVFYFSFIRCYLYYFVKLQLEFKELGDLSILHKKLYDMSNSNLGKMILLYIAKIYTFEQKKEYFLNDYMKDEENNNWKNTILSKNEKELFFPLDKYENSKSLLLNVWSKINNNNINKDFAKALEIDDIYYMMNFAYNEMSKKIKDDELNASQILLKLNQIKDDFNFNEAIKEKLNKLFAKISDLEYFNSENIKPNLKLVFNIIKFYILGFIGHQKNSLFSSLFSDKIIYLIKIFYKTDLKDDINFVESYYAMKKYLEEEYLVKNNYYPAYVCSCGRWYNIKDSLPIETKDCVCGLKIGGMNEKLVKREGHSAIFYDEKHKELFKDKINHNIIFEGKTLKEFKDENILYKIISKCENLTKLLLKIFKIDDNTFPDVFLKFIFLSQLYIEYIIGSVTEQEILDEFNFSNFIDSIIGLNKSLETFITSKNINYNNFMTYAFDTLFKTLKNYDCILDRNKITNEIKDLLKRLELRNNKEKDELIFNNIETNILTSLTYEKDFLNSNLKYLLTAAQYPDIPKLMHSMAIYKKKPLPILSAFISLDTKNSDIEKLSHIEIINDFINSFAEENSNLITRQSYENDTIKMYLTEARKNSNLGEDEKSLLDIQFEKFCDSYEEITNVSPLKITEDQPVKYILNDDKIKGKETPINLLYKHLIEIQNQFLNRIIEEYENKKNEIKEDIIIKNAIEQIKKEKPIQLCTKADIFSFNVSNNIILSFEELFSFYSLKNIFNDKNDKIDYSKYSDVKFKLSMIEKELINIILTGKKLFSQKQITYKFYLDPYKVEERTKKFDKFTELYDREELTEEDKSELLKQINNVKKIILPNLEILIFYLIQENKYIGTQKINEVKFHSNLYLDKKFIHLFNDSNRFTINKLISIYEFIEEEIWEFISDRYINKEFKANGFSTKFRKNLNEFYDSEKNRELKNSLLTTLLIRFVCRYLPYEPKESQLRDLFEMLREKNLNLSEKMQNELQMMKNTFGAKLSDAVDITRYFAQKRNINKKADKKVQEKEEKPKNEIIINEPAEEQKENIENEEEDDDDEEGRDL